LPRRQQTDSICQRVSKPTRLAEEQQLSPSSVVVLSNWVVDVAQVNRGILILGKLVGKKDLIATAKELAHVGHSSLINTR
jgi:hypothetical protein